MKINKKWYFTGLMMLLFIFASAVPVRAASYPVSVTATVNNKENNKFLKKLNSYRKKKGLPTLKMDKSLQKAAEIRAAELVVRYSHQRPNGKMPVSLSKKIAAENIAMGFADAGDVFAAWNKSPGHHKNIVHKDMKSTGICCLEYEGRTYWVNVFGKESAKQVKPSGKKKKTLKVSIAAKYLTASRLNLVNAWTMGTGEKRTLRISIRCVKDEDPGLIPNGFFTFKSSNPKVLKVNSKGVVTSVKEGKVKITIQGKKYKKLKKTFQIVVKDGGGLSYIDNSDD